MVIVRVTVFLSLLGLAAAGPVQADDNVLFRCTDAQGTLVFSNSRQGYQDCREVGRFPKPTTPATQVTAIQPTRAVAAQPGPSTSAGTPAAAGAVATPATATAPPASSSVKRGAVYRFDRDGVIHYTNVRPTTPGTKAELVFTYAIENCIACEIRSTVDWHSVALRVDEYRPEIARAAMAHGVDEALVRAVIHAESAYRANARSNKGAQGLMQLIPATAARFGVTDAYDPAQNIAGGVQYLAWLLNRFNGDIRLATAGYNAGEGAVDRHGGVPPYAETQVYVERVAILHARYRAALDAAAGVLPATASAVPSATSRDARLIGTVQ